MIDYVRHIPCAVHDGYDLDRLLSCKIDYKVRSDRPKSQRGYSQIFACVPQSRTAFQQAKGFDKADHLTPRCLAIILGDVIANFAEIAL